MAVRPLLAAFAAVPTTLLLVSCSADESAAPESAMSDSPAATAGQNAPAEPTRVTVAEPFLLGGQTYGQGPPSGMTLTISQVDTAPTCEAYDSASGGYLPEEQPYTAIEFDVELDQGGAPMSFGSPDWFRAKDPDGYVSDDPTVSLGWCDEYPEFTNSDLRAGDKHRGWVFFKDESVKPGDDLLVGWPYSPAAPAAFTVPE